MKGIPAYFKPKALFQTPALSHAAFDPGLLLRVKPVFKTQPNLFHQATHSHIHRSTADLLFQSTLICSLSLSPAVKNVCLYFTTKVNEGKRELCKLTLNKDKGHLHACMWMYFALV